MQSYTGSAPPEMASEYPRLKFGPFVLDTQNRSLSRGKDFINLSPKAFDALELLVKARGQLLTKQEMMAALWPATHVEEANLTTTISVIRKALGDEDRERKYIQTVSKTGYRLIAEVQEAKLASSQFPRLALWALPILALIAFGIYQRPKPSTAIRSIAVLPFRDLSENPPRDFLSVGLADSLITQLASSGSLVIRPTISVLKYATQPKDPIEAGKEQGVDAVLDGKILSTGNRIRVSAQLIRLKDGLSLWTGEFEDSPDRIASIETNVVKSIAQSIQLKLGSLTEKTDSLSLTQSPKAYEAYLRGRWLWNRRTEESMRRSIDAFDQSIAADPNFALAWAGLADSWALMASFSAEPGARTHPNARAAANRAIQLDPKLAEPHASLGMISFFSDWDGPAAEREFLLAIGLQPNYATAHHWRGLNLAAMGRLPEALKELEEARRLDPLSLIIGTNVGWMLYQSRRYDDAIAEFRRTLELDANFPRARTRLGITLLLKGEAASAEKELRKALELSGGDPYNTGALGYALARSGQRDAALKIAGSLIELARSHYVPPFGLALLYLGLDDQKSALEWLQKALSDRSTTMVYAKVDPILDPLRSNAQFLKLLSQMNF